LITTRVRSYLGWYRHLTLVMLAYAFLVAICVQENPPLPAREELPLALPAQPLIALTTSEVRHLLARLIWPLTSIGFLTVSAGTFPRSTFLSFATILLLLRFLLLHS
jgi:hypothetical protein